MAINLTSKENSKYALKNLFTFFNYNYDETILKNKLREYGPYISNFTTIWMMAMKKFIKNGYYVISVQGDRLEMMSDRYYNTTSLWPILHLFNPHIDNPFIIPLGTEIFVPNINEINNFFDYMLQKNNQNNDSNINILEF